MRKSINSSSIASVTNRVIDTVVVAGVAARMLLGLTYLREQMGYWLQPCQIGSDFARMQHMRRIVGPHPEPRPAWCWFFGDTALAVCPAPVRLASGSGKHRG